MQSLEAKRKLPKVHRAIVILSGGMDSACALAYACDNHTNDEVIAITFSYGQRHKKEMEAAKALVAHYNVKHIIFKLGLQQIGGSSLTDPDIDVPDQDIDEDVWKRDHVALTYVPMRNTIFIAIAAAFAEVYGSNIIYTGFNYIDSGGYPDTRPEYVEAMNKVLKLGSAQHPIIYSPLLYFDKTEIVRFGQRYNVPWEKTWSCYTGLEMPCGTCNACVQRKKGFDNAEVCDPLVGEENDLGKTIRD